MKVWITMKRRFRISNKEYITSRAKLLRTITKLRKKKINRNIWNDYRVQIDSVTIAYSRIDSFPSVVRHIFYSVIVMISVSSIDSPRTELSTSYPKSLIELQVSVDMILVVRFNPVLQITSGISVLVSVAQLLCRHQISNFWLSLI